MYQVVFRIANYYKQWLARKCISSISRKDEGDLKKIVTFLVFYRHDGNLQICKVSVSILILNTVEERGKTQRRNILF